MTTPLVFTNAHVFTADDRAGTAEAVAVHGRHVLAAGGEGQVRAAAGPDAHVVDLGGTTVLPGLVDAHNHFLATGETLVGVDVSYPKVDSLALLAAAVGAAAVARPRGRWIRAYGMDHAKYPEGRLPTRHDLDVVCPDTPVLVLHKSGHQALANTAALAARDLGPTVSDPPGGRFVRDSGGALTGYCVDAALDRIVPPADDLRGHGPNFHASADSAALLDALDAATDAYLAAGLTTVCDPQVTRRELTTYRAARALGRLRLRTVCMPLSHLLDDLERVGIAGPFGDEWLRLDGMKLYSDGALTGGTAVFTEPYGPGATFTGVSFWTPDQLRDLTVRAMRAGWRVGIHAQGDMGIEMALGAIEAGLAEAGADVTRPRIEHCGYPTVDHLDRFARHGVIPVHQPNFLRESGDDFARILGQRAHGLQPMAEEAAAGLAPVISSDSFVSSYRPLESIAASMERATLHGEVLGEDQRLTLDQAVRAHTVDAARAVCMEHLVGSLTPGGLADLVVVDGDLHAMTPRQVAAARVRLTMVDGDVAYTDGTVDVVGLPA